MRKLMICLTGAAMVLLAPTLSNAASFRADAAAPGAHSSIEQARMVKRCRMAKSWRDGPHGRHLVRHRVCHMVEVH
jgi:hypothetical protein